MNDNVSITINNSDGFSSVKNEEESQSKPVTVFEKITSKIPNIFNKKSNTSKNEIETPTPNNQPKSFKDKCADFIISKVEIETNFFAFIGLLIVGCFLLFLSLFLLPVIVLSPHKFSLCFAFGGLFVTFSFLFLKGTKGFIQSICAPNRFWITFFYFISVILSIGFSLGKKYIFSLLCALYQLVALVLFVLTFIPGGSVGIRCIKNLLSSPFTKLYTSNIANQL